MESIQINQQPIPSNNSGLSFFSFLIMIIISVMIIVALAYVLAKDQLMGLLQEYNPSLYSSLYSSLDSILVQFTDATAPALTANPANANPTNNAPATANAPANTDKHEDKFMREDREDREERENSLRQLPPPINERKPISNISAKPPTYRQNYNVQSTDFPPKTVSDRDESPSYVADDSGGWCYIGKNMKQRSCIEVGQFDKCMSGDIFPSQSICVNPKLKDR
jgi:hypothetical protein